MNREIRKQIWCRINFGHKHFKTLKTHEITEVLGKERGFKSTPISPRLCVSARNNFGKVFLQFPVPLRKLFQTIVFLQMQVKDGNF